MLTDIENTVAKMRALRAMGVHMAMDDFGTGHSSLTCLTQLPLDELKIDQSFIRSVDGPSANAVVVRHIVSMAIELGIEVVAEGVETAEQLAFLARCGCRRYQGFLFGHPEPAHRLEHRIAPDGRHGHAGALPGPRACLLD